MNRLLLRLQALSQRELALLICCGALMLLAVVWYGICQPWQQRTQRWQQSIERDRQTVIWLQRQQQRLAQHAPESAENVPSGSLLSRLSATAKRYQVPLLRIVQQEKQYLISIDATEFTRLMRWLQQLERQQRITVVRFDVAPVAGEPGRVTVGLLVVASNDDA